MKKGLLLITVAALGIAACTQTKKGPSGLVYTIHDDVKSDSIKEGDFISLNLTAKTDADSVLYNSYELGRASQTFVPKPVYDGDLFYAIKFLSKGDSATIKIDLDSAEKKGQPRPQGIKGKYIIYTLKIDEVIQKGKLTQQDFQKKIEAFFKVEGEKTKKLEVSKIQKYIDDNKLKTEKSPSGLQVVTTIEGKGTQAIAGDSVEVNYTGKLVSGKVFDTSLEEVAKKENIYNPARAPYSTLKLVVGRGNVIPGFDEGILKMKEGGKSTLIIPSSLGYGEQGMQGGMIGPFTPLVFEIELVKVIRVAAAPPVLAPTK